MADEGIYSFSGLGFNSCPNVGTIGTTEDDRACINSYFSKYFKVVSYGKSSSDGLYPYNEIHVLNGDTKAYEVIRDTVGEKPTDKIEQSGELNNTITVKFSGDVEEWGK